MNRYDKYDKILYDSTHQYSENNCNIYTHQKYQILQKRIMQQNILVNTYT